MPTKLQILGKLKFYSKPYGRQWKWRYQVHGHINEPALAVPESLQNVKIIDPLHPEPVPKEQKLLWTPSRRHPLLESFFQQPTLADHPDYKHEPIKLFDKTIKFHAGIEQVCLLTKTKSFNGLSKAIKDVAITEKDSINVQNYIKQALAFNPDKEHVPGPKIPADPKFRIGNEFGTTHYKQMKILLQNLIRLSSININKSNSNEILNRKLLENSPLTTVVKRGDDTFQIKVNSEFVLFTKQRLSALADQNEISKSVDHTFLDMYPIFPTIDLKDEHIYNLDSSHLIGIKDNYNSLNNIHTFFHIDDDKQSNEVITSRLIMFAFGYAHARSKLFQEKKQLELNENLELKQPIVVNGVSLSNGRLNYVTFQLNTLNLDTNSGIKNFVYYDMGNELYLNVPTVEKLPYPSLKNLQRLALRHLKFNELAFQKFQSILT